MKTVLQNLINQKTWYTSEMIRLVELGADPNTQDENGQSLIHLLVSYDYGQIKNHNRQAIKALVNHYSADVDSPNREGFTPLQCLLNRKTWYTKDALDLVQLGANPNTQNKDGQSLIHLLVNYESGKIAYHNQRAIETLVNRYKVDVDALNREGLTPLQCLLNRKTWYTKDALDLVQLGANPNTKNKDGQSLIHLLVSYDSRKIAPHNQRAIETLVKHHKADINSLNSEGLTPLQCLMSQEKWSTSDALTLVRLGANLHANNDKDQPLALLLKNRKLKKLLADAASKINTSKKSVAASFFGCTPYARSAIARQRKLLKIINSINDADNTSELRDKLIDFATEINTPRGVFNSTGNTNSFNFLKDSICKLEESDCQNELLEVIASLDKESLVNSIEQKTLSVEHKLQ